MPNNYCPICAENIEDEPFCSSCGDVSGYKPEEYELHTKFYYLRKQIELFGNVIVKPMNYLEKR